MKRATGLSHLRRATIVSSNAVTTTITSSVNSRLGQPAFGSGLSSTKSPWLTKIFVDDSSSPSVQSLSHSIAGTMFFSVAASSLAQDVHAKELPTSRLQSHKFCPKDVVLYQYEACPFCNKVKAFLDYYDIPYKVVEVNPISKKEIKWSDYKKVPILTVDGERMVNSSDIIDNLFKRISPEKSADSMQEVDEERKWLGWVDNHLVHVLSPNIYRSVGEALESFDYITTHGNFSFTERIMAKYTGAAAMYFVSKKLKKKHNITDERKALYESAETWVDALKGRDYLGGLKPNLADIAVFGALRPIRHLQSGKDMVEHTRIGKWYSRMEKTVGDSSRIKAQGE
ncbi:hypothetical protein Nepgr_005125 [Nepenthes gracilis]|uniref:Prostaglandin E synthase 2 n=1 Tax=Nepenthes gracilis TaxID=150966 RepID=A0AAD3XG90_NEPGR|nr:hypothetical protein Nepgr_005125 [Nepenthes gracilis]